MQHGVLLVRGGRDRVAAWVRRGTLPAYVAPAGPWCGVVAAGPSRARPPYDEAVPMLAGHPVAARLRPAIGLFAADGVALVSVSPRGWRQVTRWVAWSPGVGRRPLPGLPVAEPADLAGAAGCTVPGAAETVAALLDDPGGDAPGVLDDLATALGLPFVQACQGHSGAALPGAELVGPPDLSVARFEKIVSEEKRLERELEEGL